MRFLVWFIFSIPLSAYAATVLPEISAVREYPSIFQWFLGLLLLVAIFMANRYIRNSDENNKKQWEKLDNHESRLSRLEGEHHSKHGGRRDYDPPVRLDKES